MTKELELRKKVYSHIHKGGIPLEFGTEYTYIDPTASGEWLGKQQTIKCSNPQYCEIKDGIGYFPSNGKMLPMDSIIGKPLLLKDIMRAIEGLTVSSDGVAYIKNTRHNSVDYYEEFEPLGWDIDLSKEPKDWSDETIEALIKLLS